MNDDETLARLHDLTTRLEASLEESHDLRVMIARARHETNRWPDVRPTCELVGETPMLSVPRPSDDET